MADDSVRLADLARRLGGTEEEVEEAGPFLGPLCLDLATRPEGGVTPFAQVVEASRVPPATAARLWRALGFPDPAVTPTRLTTNEAMLLQIMAFISGELLGEDSITDVARVFGISTARAADALVDAFRIGYEVPQLEDAGRSYADVVDEYVEFTRAFLPDFLIGLGALVRRHIVGRAYQVWSPDEERATVTLDRVVGFADLVGYTARSTRATTIELAGVIDDFERGVADAVEARGGRIVKLIGDEAMFVVETPAAACALALDLVARFGDDLRVGMASGSVASIRGDYYGEVVNLASRLTATAEPGTVVVSEPLSRAVAPAVELEPIGPLALKGFPDPVPAFHLRP